MDAWMVPTENMISRNEQESGHLSSPFSSEASTSQKKDSKRSSMLLCSSEYVHAMLSTRESNARKITCRGSDSRNMKDLHLQVPTRSSYRRTPGLRHVVKMKTFYLIMSGMITPDTFFEKLSFNRLISSNLVLRLTWVFALIAKGDVYPGNIDCHRNSETEIMLLCYLFEIK